MDGDVEGDARERRYIQISKTLSLSPFPQHTTPPIPGLKGRVTAVAHNPSQPHVLACGMEAGDVVVFDLRSNEVSRDMSGWTASSYGIVGGMANFYDASE